MAPRSTAAASLPTAWLRGLCLFLTALVGWVGFLVLAGHDPAFAADVRVAGVLTLLGMLVPGWMDEARRARAERHAELLRVRALAETRHLPVLVRRDGVRVRDILSLSLVPVTDLPLPVYEAAISVPGSVGQSDSGMQWDEEIERRQPSRRKA